MRMVPATPYGSTRSRAEREVFDRLRTIKLAGDPEDDSVAFHSLNLPTHAEKRFGEIDFLICGRRGLYVLEVKGGGVECRDGRWTYHDRHGNEHTRHESPFRQAETALHGLMERLQKQFGKIRVDRFRIGYGVVFPDCEWRHQSAEWDTAVLADATRFRSFERWLDGLCKHWASKAHGEAGRSLAPPDFVREVQQFLRPDFEAVVPLGTQLGVAEERRSALTEDQYHVVDVAEANPRTLCSGGAGTGKTFLAAELARRWTAGGSKVLLACASPWLKAWLEGRLSMRGLTVATCEHVDAAATRAGIPQFDMLIVDEAQDLMQSRSLELLDEHLAGGLAGGRWCMFGDFQNQSGLVATPEPAALSQLAALPHANVPLRTNCRNTAPILGTIKLRLKADMGNRGSGPGPEVRELHTASRAAGAKELAVVLDHLLSQGLAYRQITILSPAGLNESSAALLPDRLLRRVRSLDPYGIRTFPPTDHISFAPIADFKGLENDAVVLIDLPFPIPEDMNSVAYVGMSRACTILYVLYLDAVPEQ